MRFPLLLLAVAAFAAPRPPDVPFKKIQLDGGANETAAFADLSGDGKLDVVNGEHWYEQPKVKGGEWKKHRFRELEFFNNYIDAFTDIPLDVNGDGRIDIVTCMWFGKKIAWYENPGRMGAPWKEHIIEDQWNVEFMFLVDLNNDGKEQELLPQFGRGPTAWYELKGGKFIRHIVHPDNFGHGIGAGDINKDGRNDILTPRGWLEAPANPTAEGQWALHQDWTAKKHTGFLHVVDINGDGRNDVFYPHAHDYGIYWLRQEADGRWTEFKIDDAWSQAHATAFVDINGDGQKDFIAGKRFLAHDHDPGAQEPLGIYWYEWRKSGNNVEWIRHVIDYSSSAGAGMQIAVADYDGDGDLDFAVGGKSGAFLFENTSPKKGTGK
jgi:hypothetical protein